MFILDLLTAFVITFIVIIVFSTPLRRHGGAAFWMFAIILFLAAWAGGLWISPFGPVIYNIYWMPFFIAAIICALLITALTPESRKYIVFGTEKNEKADDDTLRVIGLFSWILVVCLLIVIILKYVL